MSSFPQNIGLGIAPQVWLFSDFDGYNQFRQGGYPPYLTLTQQARLERLRQARLLHDGRHWRMFIFEERTQFDFPESLSMGRKKRLYVPYNLLKLISKKSADLLFGDQPAVKVEDEVQGQKLNDLLQRTALHSLLAQIAVECSHDGEAFIESVIQDGQVYLKRVDAADVFPQGPLLANGQYGSYVKYNAKNLGTNDKPDWRLLITRYLPGAITRELKQLDQQGFILPRQLTLNEWPQEDPQQQPIEPETKTGLDQPSIVWIPNELVRDMPVSDYDGLIELQDSLNAKNTQLARVLAKHSDPKMAAPVAAGDEDGGLRSDYNVYFFRSKEEIPQYITWNAELASALEDRKETQSALLTLAEMSPILLGIREGSGTHNAYKSVRLEAINSITKAARKGILWKAALRRILTLAQDMEMTIPGERYDRGDLGIEMRDGLPSDTDSRATELATLRGAGLLSVERGVEILLQDPAAIEKELKALADEAAAATPSILMQKPGMDGQEATTEATAGGLEADAQQEQTAGDIEVAA